MHNEYDTIETPIGFIPKYEDLKALFRQVFDREYTNADYDIQFATGIKNRIDKR